MKITKFIPITKINDEERMVYGWASTPDLDSDGEIITIEALSKALPGYMKFPTLREMHQPKVAGVTRSAEIVNDVRGTGLFIGAKIVSDSAWELVKAGAYKAFSVGGEVLNRVNNVINDMALIEISLVDVPANPNAVITLFKMDKNKVLGSLKRISFDNNPIAEGMRKGVIHFMEETEVKLNDETDVQATQETIEVEKPSEVEESNTEAEKSVSVIDEKLEKVNTILADETQPKKEDEVAKSVNNMGKDINKVADVVVKIAQTIQTINKRLQDLESQPLPTKSKAAFVSKVEEKVDSADLKTKKSRLAELDALLEKEGKSNFAKSGLASEALKLQEEIALLEA